MEEPLTSENDTPKPAMKQKAKRKVPRRKQVKRTKQRGRYKPVGVTELADCIFSDEDVSAYV